VITQEMLVDPRLLKPEEIAALLPIVENIEAWSKQVREQALNLAVGGTTVPGYKLVEGRSIRKFANTDGLVAKLHELGLSDAQIYDRTLLGVADIEKLVGKPDLKQIEPFIEKPSGKPTLVTETDKRAAVKLKPSAADEFATPILED